MRFMFTTALASAVMFAGPALAAGDKVQSTTGMTAPESSAAQLPGSTADSGKLRQNFESAGFSNWQPADNGEIYRMQSGDGQAVWVVLMPENFQVGSAEQGEAGIDRQPGDLAESAGSALEQQDLPDASQQAEAGDMPQRGERADIGETFEGAESGQQQDLARGQDQPQPGQDQDIAEAPDLPEPRSEGLAETQDQPGMDGQPDVAEAPELPETGDLPRIAETEGADVSEPGIAGETQPEGFAAQIPGELGSDLESAGFQQVQSVDGADLFRAETEDGRLAFIIVGELGGGELGVDQQEAPGLDQQQPGAATDIPDITPGNEPDPAGQPQQ